MVIGRITVITVFFLSFVWQAGISFAKYSGGSGVGRDPYKIGTAADLFALAADTCDYDKNFVLTANIDLGPKRPGSRVFSAAVIAPDSDNSDFSFEGTAFTGVFDGAGYKIKNLVINTNGAGNDYLGLFGCSYGEIKNLSLEKISITAGNGSYWVGLLVGENSGTVSNCSSAGVITGNDDFGPAGGLTGNNYGSVTGCFSKVTITTANNASYIGGFVGYNLQGTISNCLSSGSISDGDNSYDVGGLVGFNEDGDIINSRSVAIVTVSQTADAVGGLVGENTGVIRSCSSGGAVSGGPDSNSIGGLTGNNGGVISNCRASGIVTGASGSNSIGGLVGYNYDYIAGSYSLGAVSGLDNSAYIGGLAGYSQGSITNCSSSSKVAGSADSASIGGLIGENTGDIGNCSSAGSITGANSSYYIGGLVGNNFEGSISQSYSAGAVAGQDDSSQIGGLVGGNDTGNISCCYAAAKVKGGNNSGSIGGLVGDNSGSIFGAFSIGSVAGADGSYYVGGIAGYCGDGNVSNCYSTSAVTSGMESDSVGGVVGDNESSLSNCYYAGIVGSGNNSDNIGAVAGWNAGDVNSCFFLASSGPYNGNGRQLTDKQMKWQGSFSGWDFVGETANGQQDIWTSRETIGYPKLAWYSLDNYLLNINKCTVIAGSNYNDNISFSGQMNPVYDDLYLTNVIQIIIGSENMPDPCVIMISINSNDYRKTGKFSFSGTDEYGIKKSFSLDFKTHQFSFAAQNVSLSGLSCPLKVRVVISRFIADAEVDETIVNGPKKVIPINLLMGVKNSVRADKLKVKDGSKSSSDSFIVTGVFSVQDVGVDMAASPLSVTFSRHTFTIPANKLKFSNGKYSCSNVKLDGNMGVASAVFDFNRGTFAVTIKNTTVDAYLGNTAGFAVDFAGFSESTDIAVQ